MNAVFYIAAAVALISTVMVITRLNAIHALLEVIIYAGAIMVLFVFVVMLLNLGPSATAQESQWLNPKSWIVPAILALILVGELAFIIARGSLRAPAAGPVEPKQVGVALFGPYLLGVELVSLLLLAGMVGAYHLGRDWGVREQESNRAREWKSERAGE